MCRTACSLYTASISAIAIKKFKKGVGIDLISAKKVRKQGTRFWYEKTLWCEIIYKPTGMSQK